VTAAFILRSVAGGQEEKEKKAASNDERFSP
jgi:hypothetical protein